MRNASVTKLSLVLLLTFVFGADALMAQKGPAATPASANSPTGAAAPTPASGSAAAGLQGRSFTSSEWDKLAAVPMASDFGSINEKDMVYVCYKVTEGKNAATPFVLQNTTFDSTPDVPIPDWKASTPYTNAAWVMSPNHDGHYYEAQSAGTSGGAVPTFPAKEGDSVTETAGSMMTWKDLGEIPHNPFVPKWLPNKRYTPHDLVVPVKFNGHYYEAQNLGTSEISEPKFQAAHSGQTIDDGRVLKWKDMGKLTARGKHVCADISSSNPLLMNQMLVVAIDMAAIPLEVQKRITILNFNVTTTQVAPINPTPFVPNVAAGSATGTEGGSGPLAAAKRPLVKHQIYYLTWNSLIAGDTTIAINVNLVYTPVAPGLPWAAQTFYPAGSIVMSTVVPAGAPNAIGHYYLARNSGVSSDVPPDAAPAFANAVTTVPVFAEGSGLSWRDQGLMPPSTLLPVWAARIVYGTGDLVTPPTAKLNGHYYRALTIGHSGSNPPTFTGKVNGETFADSADLSWKDMGTTVPSPVPPVWNSQTDYATGDVVMPPSVMTNGHYYRAQAKSAMSAAAAPNFPADRQTVRESANLAWTDMGPTALNPVPATWTASTAFAAGAQITPVPANGHYYLALTAGVTGPNAPPFPLDGSAVLETSNLVWTDSGTAAPSGGKIKRWVRDSPFMVGDVIQDTSTGHYYTVIQAGISGSPYPSFAIPAPETATEVNKQITWQDLGTTLPASYSPGLPQPSDQTVSLITYSFPQSHSLSYFSLTSGVVVSTIQSRTFLNQNSSSTTPPSWVRVNNGPIVDPVLALTAYIKPVDAERKWTWSVRDLTPGPTIAFSLTNPSTNFYFGGSSAIFNRNIQVLYGVSFARVNVLAPADLQLSGTTAATRQQFAKGGFIGVTFNILGFIQSLPGL